MAMLEDVYLFVQEEKVSCPVEVSEHVVETGVALTDHVSVKAETLHLSGEIVGERYHEVAEKMRGWQRAGAALRYAGRHLLQGVQIVEFGMEYTHRIAEGCSFTMLLRQVRVARNMYAVGLGYQGKMEVQFTNGSGIVRVMNLAGKSARYHVVGQGETVWYLAGQYRARGVTAEGLRENNSNRDVFRQGHQGDFNYLKTGVQLMLGVW